MLSPIILTTLFSVATVLARPQPLPAQSTTRYTTDVTYYQGESTSDSCGLEAVSSGNITSGVCNTAYTYALTIQPLADRDCEYVLWEGSSTCGSEATQKSKSFLPADGHPVCVTTGVLDGGKFEHASGKLRCNIDIN
jgi:hypothetical protein